MTCNGLLEFLIERILEIKKDSIVLIRIDGVEASSKTTFAYELVE